MKTSLPRISATRRGIGMATRWWWNRTRSTSGSGFQTAGCRTPKRLRLTERFSRPDFNTLRYEVQVNDPGTYTRPWSSAWTLSWVADQDIPEYFCQDNSKDEPHMVGPGQAGKTRACTDMPVTYNDLQRRDFDEIQRVRSVGRGFRWVPGGGAASGASLLLRRVRQQESRWS